jgi:Rx N-terminal domain
MAGWIMAQAINKLSSLFSSATSSSSSTSSNGLSSDPSSDESLEELRRLYRKMKRIDALLRDADERDVQSHSQRLRLSELREVAYDAEDVIDEYQYEVLRSQIQSACVHNPVIDLVFLVRKLNEWS